MKNPVGRPKWLRPMPESFVLRLPTIASLNTSACWLWKKNIYSNGYGRFSWNYVTHLAHRVSYELFCGPIPDGLHIDHLCRNKRCVRPSHLEPVTHQENTYRHFSQRTICKRGHKLTEDNIVTKYGGRWCKQCRERRY